MDPYEALIGFLNRISPLEPGEEEEIRQSFLSATYKKGEYITEYGKVNDKLTFVSKGYCRVYVIDLEGNEVTIHMAGNIDFVGAISSFLTQQSSEEYVQAVTDVEALNIRYAALEELYNKRQKWERLGRMIMESLFLRKQQRVISFINETAETRYRKLLDKKPDMILSVPNQYTASFLGIKPETLSRIRAKIS